MELVERLEATGRRRDRSADDPHPAAGGLRPAGRGVRARRRLRLDRVLERQRASTRSCARLLAGPSDLRALGGVQPVRRRPGDGRAARAAIGLKVDLTPAEYRAGGGPARCPRAATCAGRAILLPHADIGRELIADELRKQGAEVTEVVAYRTVAVDAEREGEPDIYRMLLRAEHRRRHVHERVGGAQLRRASSAPSRRADLLATTVVACIGPVTAEAATQSNIKTTIQPTQLHDPRAGRRDREVFRGDEHTEKTDRAQRKSR